MKTAKRRNFIPTIITDHIENFGGVSHDDFPIVAIWESEAQKCECPLETVEQVDAMLTAWSENSDMYYLHLYRAYGNVAEELPSYMMVRY